MLRLDDVTSGFMPKSLSPLLKISLWGAVCSSYPGFRTSIVNTSDRAFSLSTVIWAITTVLKEALLYSSVLLNLYQFVAIGGLRVACAAAALLLFCYKGC